jgi:hypothetical protein
MTPDQLATAARLLLGRSDWQRPLARVLRRPGAERAGIDDRLVRRWATGTRPVPGWVGDAIRELATERRSELAELETIGASE